MFHDSDETQMMKGTANTCDGKLMDDREGNNIESQNDRIREEVAL